VILVYHFAFSFGIWGLDWYREVGLLELALLFSSKLSILRYSLPRMQFELGFGHDPYGIENKYLTLMTTTLHTNSSSPYLMLARGNRMLPSLIPNPSLKNPHSQSHESQDNSNNNTNQCCHHDISSATSSFKPLFEYGARSWILQLIDKIHKSRSEVEVRNFAFVIPPVRCIFEAEAVCVEG
jgi:hypothetical protein